MMWWNILLIGLGLLVVGVIVGVVSVIYAVVSWRDEEWDEPWEYDRSKYHGRL